MNLFNKGGAATLPKNNRNLKKESNTKVNPLINFQLGLVAVLAAVYFIVEFATPVREKLYQQLPSKTMTLEPTMGEFVIEKPVVIDKHVRKEAVQKPQSKQTVVSDPSKAPVIDNSITDEMSKVAVVKPVIPRISNKDASRSNSTTSKRTPVAPAGASNVNMVMEVPLFPGCDASLDRADRINCLNNNMQRFIQKKFDTSIATDQMARNGSVRITVMFTIGTDGLPKDVVVKAPNKELEKEAHKVISRLPKMVPGKNNGVAVDVTYVLPIVYKVS